MIADEKGYTPGMWKMADLGWMGILFPEEYSGYEATWIWPWFCMRQAMPASPALSFLPWSWED
jgi:alkylation response protein AidB-like acyl-CoA dehydrogenase